MAQFSAQNANFTPSTSQDNWLLDTNATTALGKIKVISWGGSDTTSNGYRTRWYRPTTIGSSTFTALTVQAANSAATNIVRAGTFATAATPPAEPVSLMEQAWNSLGGGGVVVLPIGGEWFVFGNGATTVAGQIGCRNTAGVGANLSSYGVIWEE